MCTASVKVVCPWIFMIATPLEQKNVVYCCIARMGNVRCLHDRKLIHLLKVEFPPTLDQSWMNDYRPFPISKWKILTWSTLCSGMLTPAHRKIGTTNSKGLQSCPTPHWKTSCACTNWWSAWCAGHCCTTWSSHTARLRSHRSLLRIRSDQNEANTRLTCPRWNVAMPPWQAHVAQ